MNTFEVFSPSLEEEIEGIWHSVEIAFDEHGLLCDDGHWMTDEEFSILSDEDIIQLHNLIYNTSITLEKLEAEYSACLCQTN